MYVVPDYTLAFAVPQRNTDKLKLADASRRVDLKGILVISYNYTALLSSAFNFGDFPRALHIVGSMFDGMEFVGMSLSGVHLCGDFINVGDAIEYGRPL